MQGRLDVTEKSHRVLMTDAERREESFEPSELTSGDGHSTILDLTKRTGDSRLLLGSP